MTSLASQLLAWLCWHDQPPGKFRPLKPGCDLASIVLRHREEIGKQAYRATGAGKRDDMSYEADPDYCACCYSAAKKRGRAVKQTDVCEWPICSLCETRIRNGLVHYVPSNGTEGMMFLDRCDRCRHFNEGGTIDASIKACKWGIADKLLNMMCAESDSASGWHDPAMLNAETCPATCLKFTDRDDPAGARYDPPPPDCQGQMMLDELDVPVERVPSLAPAAAQA